MKTYTRTDLCVRRVLATLKWTERKKSFGGSKSLAEITDQYNEIFPPGILGKIIGMHQSETEVKAILDFLIAERLVAREPLSFTDRYLKTPMMHYSLSQAGIQYTNEKR